MEMVTPWWEVEGSIVVGSSVEVGAMVVVVGIWGHSMPGPIIVIGLGGMYCRLATQMWPLLSMPKKHPLATQGMQWSDGSQAKKKTKLVISFVWTRPVSK